MKIVDGKRLNRAWLGIMSSDEWRYKIEMDIKLFTWFTVYFT